MKVLIPLTLTNCQADCPYYVPSIDAGKLQHHCTGEMVYAELTDLEQIPDWCPLKKYQVKPQLESK